MHRFHALFFLLALYIGGCYQSVPQSPQISDNETNPDVAWPELPTSGFIAGRVAIQEDVSNGDAVFAAFGSVTSDLLQIDIPQYALLTNDDGSSIPVFVIQAEVVHSESGDVETYGLHPVEGGPPIVGVSQNVKLMGTDNRSR